MTTEDELKAIPGPWEVRTDSNEDEEWPYQIVAPNLPADEEWEPCKVVAQFDNSIDFPAAFLISAAPDLFEELRETHAALCFTSGYIGSLRYERNKAAILKALGQP